MLRRSLRGLSPIEARIDLQVLEHRQDLDRGPRQNGKGHVGMLGAIGRGERRHHGKHRRDFTYIDDIVEGIIRIQDKPPLADKAWDGSDASSSSAPYKVFNIGNNQPVKLMTFIEAIEQAVGKDAVKEYLPMQDGDVPATFADIDDLQQAVGFKPATSIELGVAEFVRWYKAYYKV